VARTVGVRLQFLEARGPTDIDKAHSEMTSVRAGALTGLWGSMFFGERIRLVDLAARIRLPALYPLREFVDTGGLKAYGGNLADLIRRAASYVNKALAGSKPGSLVEQPTNLELLINVKTAKAHGLEAPPSLLARADEVIE
jgi:putative tryptophan/tyrosine transport system substrate-binding protein